MGHLIVDIAGVALTAEDRSIVTHPDVAGVILFGRNYASKPQLKDLIDAIKQCKPEAIVAVDQEGGSVVRFHSGFSLLPSMAEWSQRYSNDPQSTLNDLDKVIYSSACELNALGITMNLMPVLDLDFQRSEIIGSRSLGSEPSQVSRLATVILAAMKRARILAVAKHFPGHGGVVEDSHKNTPIDMRSYEILRQQDMQPYFQLSEAIPVIMPAHIVYPAVDNTTIATFSQRWMQSILRGQVGYRGKIITDDLSMHAAACLGGPKERVAMARDAGADWCLLCNDRAAVRAVLSM